MLLHIILPSATARNGTYIGVHNRHYAVDYFLGVPFAQAPVDDLRLAPARRLNVSFSGTRNATHIKPACVHFSAATIDRLTSENCLTLNVYRPSGYENQSLLVLVWIYGSRYIQGSNSDPGYSLMFIVQKFVQMNKPIVAVAINNRLNGFGFMGGPVIQDQGLANLGLRDQRLALHWMQENIEVFGGDTAKVTIWGQSAGARCDDSLFRAAIADSGGPLGFQGPSNATQLDSWNAVLNLTGCAHCTDALQCLRKVGLDHFANAIENSDGDFGPIYDDGFLQTHSSGQLVDGESVKVPLLIGSNTDDSTGFVGSAPYIGALRATAYPDEDSFLELVNTSIIDPSAAPAALTAISILYLDVPAIGYRRAATFAGDNTIHRGRRLTAQTWTKYNVPAYSYLFDQWPIGGLPTTTDTIHFTEVPLVQNNEDRK
ncbi:Alpha/Beta hydrolase protein [Aspergillus filifer]